jgi:hypothetical protein
MDNDLFKIAIDDARNRHKAVLDLIYFTDNQAMNLLRLYVTLALAATSAIIASFGSKPAITVDLAVGLSGAVAVLFYGSWQCFKAMSSASLNLPGRDPDFWIWAAENKQTPEELSLEYLKAMVEGSASNNAHNAKSAAALRKAKLAGVIAVPVAAIIGLSAILVPYAIRSLVSGC